MQFPCIVYWPGCCCSFAEWKVHCLLGCYFLSVVVSLICYIYIYVTYSCQTCHENNDLLFPFFAQMDGTGMSVLTAALAARLVVSAFEIWNDWKLKKELRESPYQQTYAKIMREKEEKERRSAEMMIENDKEKKRSLEEKMRKMQENILEKAPCHSFKGCMCRLKKSLFSSNI
jgi:hypothetical protein